MEIKRKHPRVRVDCDVNFTVLSKEKDYEDFKSGAGRSTLVGKARDLSQRGLLFHTPTPLNRKDFLQIQFHPEGVGKPIEAMATVAWCRFQEKQAEYAVGLRVLNLKKGDDGLLEKLVAAHKPLPLPVFKKPGPLYKGPKTKKGQAHLHQDEELVHETKIHWMVNKVAIGLGVLFLGFGAVAFPFDGLIAENLGYVLVALLIFASVEAWYLSKHSKLSVTNKRVIFKSGMLEKHEIDAHLSHIKLITVKQHAAGKALGYGNLLVTHRSGKSKLFKSVVKPHEVARNFKRQLEQNFD